MKRVAFAWVTKHIDFSTYEEALHFFNTYTKGRKVPNENGRNADSWDIKPENYIYCNGGDEYPWTIVVEEPYRNYNMG